MNMSEPRVRWPPCTCCDFLPDEWPWEDGVLVIRSCMKICTYCHETLRDAASLRRHLRSGKHKKQNLEITPGLDGRPSIHQASTASPNILPANPTAKEELPAKPTTKEEQLRWMEKEGILEWQIESFRGLKLQTVDEMLPADEKLWTECNGRVPSKTDAQHCWLKVKPTDTKLFEETLLRITESKGNISKAYSVVRKDGVDGGGNPATVLAQLWNPDAWNTQKLRDLRILEDDCIAVSPTFRVEAYQASNLQAMLTPKHSVSQLHFDPADGQSLIVGDKGSKIFALFPSSALNIELMLSTAGKDAALETIGSKLEGGLTFTLSPGEAIDLPQSCFHKVWTIEGCFLATLDFTTPGSIGAYLRIIGSGLDKILTEPVQIDLFDWFLTTFNIALLNGFVDDALRVWLEIANFSLAWAQQHPLWFKEAKSILGKFLASPASIRQNCPCERMGQEESFRLHFRRCHLLSSKRRLENSDDVPSKRLRSVLRKLHPPAETNDKVLRGQ
ncbi:hypothetical protein WAI453_013558 [Rhynchosporium graminicola]